ncbi:MAG: tetratricopeptide repeat protein [Candidatus Electrothrix sp. GW3-4]|uniref:tetratricopeptide repeat protein n=1 Tax=Candidatus Electrothrix sp. GW3-4 TaxID=3126740 RepID=UPI0030D0BCE3
MFDRNEQHTTEFNQTHNGPGDNVRDKYIINNYLLGSVDYQQLVQDIKDAEELLAGIAPDKIDLRLKQSAKVEELKHRLVDFKADVFRLHELFTRIPINTERLRKAKAHFDKGEFREADAVLKAEEIQQDVERLKLEEQAAKNRLAAVRKDLADRAQEFLLKARLSLLNPVKEDEDRFKRTEGYFEQALATARTGKVLHEYAVFLSKHNDFSRAEPLYREALEQLRRYGKANPEVFLANVAATVNNLANLHKTIIEYTLAEDEYKKALKAYRTLAKLKPEVFSPSVAMTLNNLAVLHSQREKYDSALAEYQEALEIRRDLAKTNPEAFLPDVAATLHDLATLYYQTKKYDPALAEYREVLRIRRDLAELHPKEFLSDVAMTLNNLAALHYKTKQYDSALAEYEESLTMYRRFSEFNPKAFMSYVAGTLNNLASLHKDTNQYGAAEKEYGEALEIYRALDQNEPKTFLPDLVTTLLNLSIFYLQSVPDKAKSVAYAQEARDILKPLCDKAPHLQEYLDMAEGLLKDNKAKSEASIVCFFAKLSLSLPSTSLR